MTGLRNFLWLVGLLAASAVAVAQPADDAGIVLDAGVGSSVDVDGGLVDAGAGSAGTGSGSGSASSGSANSGSAGPKIIQLPDDVSAPEVNAAASPTAIRLGGRFTLIITAVYAPGVECNLEEPLSLGPAFEVRRKDSSDKPRADGKIIREWQADVLAWELGDLQIAPINVTYTVNGRAGQVQTNPVRLRVDGVLGEQVDDPRAMRDLQPPRTIIAADWYWPLLAAGIAGLLAAGGIAWWISRRLRRRHVVALTGGATAAPTRIDMTSARALEALMAIETSGVLSRDDDRRTGYAEMVEVIRDYVGARYHVATRDLTSSELSRRLARVAPEEERTLIDDWLGRCDLVKYGGLRASALEAATVLADARALVVATPPQRRAA